MSDGAAELIDLRCAVCGEAPETLVRPSWAVLAAFNTCVGWLEPAGGVYRSEPPTVGEAARLELSYPFGGRVGIAFWAHFVAGDAYYNGYGHAPQELPNGRMARVILTSIGVPQDRKIIAMANVLEVLDMNDLLALPLSLGRLEVELGTWMSYSTHTSCGDLHFAQADFESDAGYWAIWKQRGSSTELIITGEWDFHRDFAYAGHRLLTAAELP